LSDLDILEYLCPVTARAFGECLRDIDRIRIAVARDVDATDDVIQTRKGNSERISSGPTTLTVRPKTLAIEALRCSSSMRPAVVATDTEPHWR